MKYGGCCALPLLIKYGDLNGFCPPYCVLLVTLYTGGMRPLTAFVNLYNPPLN